MATITVGTNSYVTEAELTTYATDRGVTIAAADKSVLLIKAMDFLEVQRWTGYKTVSTQALQWPRVLCASNAFGYPYGYDYGTYLFIPCEYDSTTVPNEIKSAQMIAALLIDGGEDIQPTVARAVKREKVDVIEVEYMDNALATSYYSKLQDYIRPFLKTTLSVTRV